MKVTAINGKPPEYDGEPLEVATPGSFDLHVDIFGYLESIGKTIEELDTCILTIPGKVRSLNEDVHCAVYSSTDSEKFICDAINGGNAYHFLLKRIYEETGNCDFRVFIDNPFVNCKNAVASYEDDYPHEIFSVARSFFSLDMSIGGDKLTIEHAPNKCKYIIGESFDRTGLAVCLHYPNGESVLVNDFTVHNETQPCR